MLKRHSQGNCRRRKIRCIPSPFDNQGRCTNCIRLKKECSFYPVDQQPPTDPRGESSSRASTAPKGTSASSSPATSNGVPAEPSANQPFRTLTMQQVPSMALPTMKAVTAETVPPEANSRLETLIVTIPKLTTDCQVPSNVPGNRPYGFAGQSAPNWIPTDAGHSPNSKPGDMNAIWRPYPPESPASSQFSSYSHGPPSSTTWTSAGSESESRDDLAWGNYPPPVRSMSYGGEPLTGHHPAHYPPIPHGRQFDRRSSTLSDAYTPSLAVAVPNMDVGHTSSIEQLVPLSAGEIPPPNFEGWHHQHQPHQQQSQLPYSKPGEPFGDWELGGGGGGQQPHTNEPGPHNEPDPAGYYARR